MGFDMNKYQVDYRKNNYDNVTFLVKKGKKKELQQYAKDKGVKLSEYIRDLIIKDSGLDI